MNRRTLPSLAALFSVTLISAAQVPATQAPTRPMPPDYRGPQTYVPGVFVTPVPSAPFTADVDVVTHQKLPDGTENVRTTINHIARDSAGRIYNERRVLVPPAFKGEPRLLSAHIYDPNTRLNIFFDPQTRIARQTILPPAVAARQMPIKPPLPNFGGAISSSNAMAGVIVGPSSVNGSRSPSQPQTTQVDLGDQVIDGTTLHGTEKQRTLSAQESGTGKPVIITDQYWYSPDLSVYLIVKHNDPRTGEQIVAVTHIDRHEPEVIKFTVPSAYKLVDETPPPPLAPSAGH